MAFCFSVLLWIQTRGACKAPHGRGGCSLSYVVRIVHVVHIGRGVYGIASTRGGGVCMWRGVSRVVEALASCCIKGAFCLKKPLFLL